jgi:hypothetical protein
MGKIQRQIVLSGTLAVSYFASAQHLPPFGNITPEVALVSPAMIRPAVAPCAKSAEPFDVDDYNGPFNQLVARFSQRVEKSTVHVPRHHAGLKPCSMDAGGKFRLFLDQELDPINFLGTAWDAGTAQIDRDDPSFGRGVAGYGKRYAAAATDNVAGDFFGVFLYPAIFHQDPRYYRLGQGNVKMRLGHALEHRWIATNDSGRHMFNFSEWCGTISSKALSNLYHPGNPRGFGPTASRVGFSIGSDMAWDVLREFWPEIAHKFKLPFRAHSEPYIGNLPASPEPVKTAPPAPANTLVEEAVR